MSDYKRGIDWNKKQILIVLTFTERIHHILHTHLTAIAILRGGILALKAFARDMAKTIKNRERKLAKTVHFDYNNISQAIYIARFFQFGKLNSTFYSMQYQVWSETGWDGVLPRQ